MTKTLFRVICTNAIGARNLNTPSAGLEDQVLYDVVADVNSAKTSRMPEGGASGYLVRNSDTGVVLPQLYRRDRFVREEGFRAGGAAASVDSDALSVGDVVICVDADGARSMSEPETMLEQDEEYRILADVDDAATGRQPEGGSSGFVVQRTEDDATLAGIWRRDRFARA